MTNESSCYAGVAGIAFAHRVVDQLGVGAIAPTPPNYELWATYRSGVLPDLNREISDRLGAGETLTPALCDELYERYFTPAQSFEQLVQTGESVAHELSSALTHLRDAAASSGSYAGELDTVATAIEGTSEPATIQILVQRLVTETRAVAVRNKVLEYRMESSSKQMAALQANMRQATLDAVTDSLTGLANRRHFDRVLARNVREASETGQPLCLIMCDIDHFKQINDTWGHPVGDQVIRYVASTLRVGAPQTAIAARYGGEEYALLLPGMTLAEGQVIALDLCGRVRARKLSRKSSGDVMGVVTISLGVASLEAGEASASLVRRADACLYQAKRAGRNRVMSELGNSAAAA